MKTWLKTFSAVLAAGIALGGLHKYDLHTIEEARVWEERAWQVMRDLQGNMQAIRENRILINEEKELAETYRKNWRGTRAELAERNSMEKSRIESYNERIMISTWAIEDRLAKAESLMAETPWRVKETGELSRAMGEAHEFLERAKEKDSSKSG